MDSITSQAAVLDINVKRGDETQQLPTNLVLWRIAGGYAAAIPARNGNYASIPCASCTTDSHAVLAEGAMAGLQDETWPMQRRKQLTSFASLLRTSNGEGHQRSVSGKSSHSLPNEDPVVWRQLVESGYERTTEERTRTNNVKSYEVRSGQRTWASVVQGPVSLKPGHQHDDHEHDFWALNDEDTQDSDHWRNKDSTEETIEKCEDEWANECWQSWWHSDSTSYEDEPMECQEKRTYQNRLDDAWAETPIKRQR
eukprot:1011343-Amphidinium_carterae.2